MTTAFEPQAMTLTTLAAAPTPPALAPAAAPALVPVALYTPEGRLLTAGRARITRTASGWTAIVSHLDRPGSLARLYFTERSQDVAVRFADGRAAKAQVASTSFVDGERICQLKGVGPLA